MKQSSFLFRSTPLVVANWKQYLTVSESIRLCMRFDALGAQYGHFCTLGVAPSAIALGALPAPSSLLLGAQHSSIVTEGAYTGEVSPRDIRSRGGVFAIVGHSERRHFFGETDALIRDRLVAAYAGGLVPILCIGETEKIYARGAAAVKKHLATQLAVLHDLPLVRNGIIIAYEPVWAIGTGRTPSFDEVSEICRFIARELSSVPAILDTKNRILYGGSVNKDNAAGFLREGGFSGLLVGGASTRFAEFRSIIHSLKTSL